MSKSTTIETNADKVFEQFREFTTKEMRKTLKSAIGAAANKLRGTTKKLFRSALPKAKQRNPKYNDTLLDAVKRSKVEETKGGEIYTKVHIMGTRSAGSGTFRARFFEKGTANRQTHMGYNRGSIRPLNYFSTANAEFQSDYNSILSDAIAKAVDKINRQKFKTK